MSEIQTTKKLDFVTVVRSMKLTTNTKETYITAMRSYNKYCLENSLKQDIQSLKSWITSSDSSSTQNLRISAIKRVFNTIYRDDKRLLGFFEELKEIKPAKRNLSITEGQYLTKEEVDKIKEGTPEKMALIIESLFVTGVRISELLNIKISDCLSIRDGEVYQVKILRKGNKEDMVWISKELYDRLNSVFAGKTYLFECCGNRYNRSYVTRMVAKAGLKIGKKISAHTLRHSRAHDLMDSGVTIDKVSKFLGHTNLNTTSSFYLHTKPSLEELGVI